MASQVLSGANNASYTNNTGQNVRLIINYMSNVTSMTWAGVSVTAESTTIGKDIQNITGEFRKILPGQLIGDATDYPGQLTGTQHLIYAKVRELKTEIVDGCATTINENLGNDGSLPSGVDYGGRRTPLRLLTRSQKQSRTVNTGNVQVMESFYDQNVVHYIPKTISRGGDFPTELMLANGESFSSVCGAFNAIVIKEDGT